MFTSQGVGVYTSNSSTVPTWQALRYWRRGSTATAYVPPILRDQTPALGLAPCASSSTRCTRWSGSHRSVRSVHLCPAVARHGMKGAGMAAYAKLGARGVGVDGGVANVAVVDAEASSATSSWPRPRLLATSYYSLATHILTHSHSHTVTHSHSFTQSHRAT